MERDYYLSDLDTISPYYIEENVFKEINNENQDINIIPMKRLEKENIQNAIEKCDGT